MDAELLKIVGQIAGIGGIGIGAFLLLFRDIIRRNIFPNLKRDDAYRLLRLIVILVWSIALVGVVAWTYAITRTNSGDGRNINARATTNNYDKNTNLEQGNSNTPSNTPLGKGNTSPEKPNANQPDILKRGDRTPKSVVFPFELPKDSLPATLTVTDENGREVARGKLAPGNSLTYTLPPGNYHFEIVFKGTLLRVGDCERFVNRAKGRFKVKEEVSNRVLLPSLGIKKIPNCKPHKQQSMTERRPTTHSTGARVSLSFIENLSVLALNARPVNSGVGRSWV